MNAVQKLRQLVGEIRAAKQPAEAQAAWELAGRLLGRMPMDAAEANRVCAARDADGLDALVARLEGPPPAPKRAEPAPAPRAAPADPALAEQMDMALRAFRKRLKVARLADESKLRGRRLTSGKASEIDAILPPGEFPDEVWQALAKAGKLKHTGQGFYALP